MLNLALTTDKLQVITDAAVTVDVVASFIDCSTADPPVVKGSTSGKQLAAIATATTTDIVAAPAASAIRNVKALHIRNKHATSTVAVTVQYNANAVLYEIHKATLLAGEMLEYVEGVGFFVAAITRKAYFNRRVTADVTFATAASFADVTGLTAPLQSGKFYNFQAHLYHIGNATTTGAQFGYNIGAAPTVSRIQVLDVILGSVTAATMGSNVADVTARDTAAAVETTGAATVVLAILSGYIQPSADGTFAIRATSEVTVASGLIVKAGSWLQIWESDN